MQDQQVGITPAHFDILAESIANLTVYRPFQDQQDFGPKFGKQDLIDSTSFVQYDIIDQVEAEEAESQQINIGDEDNADINSQEDTLIAQSKVRSREIYKN